MEPVLPVGWLPGVRYRQQAVNYPKFRVKMFGMSVGVVGVWAMSDVQVSGRYDNISFNMKTTY